MKCKPQLKLVVNNASSRDLFREYVDSGTGPVTMHVQVQRALGEDVSWCRSKVILMEAI